MPHGFGKRSNVVPIAGLAALGLVAAVAAITNASASTEGAIPAGAIRAASFAEQSGARTENTVDAGGGQNVGWLSNGDWMRYSGVDLGPAGTLTTSLRFAAAYADRTGTVEVRADALTGPLVA